MKQVNSIIVAKDGKYEAEVRSSRNATTNSRTVTER